MSLDGFRFEYLNDPKIKHPNIDKWVENGVVLKLNPEFPSKTFPNHYSMITGLYPESHGIVGNVFYDPKMELMFNFNNFSGTLDPRWWLGEPLWNLFNRSNLKTASYYWPGSEVEINGSRPTYYKTPYNSSVSSISKINQILRWIDMSSDLRPSFITAYFSQIDTVGHLYGPDSPLLARSIEELDSILTLLFYGISSRQNDLDINLIIVSDHGMDKIIGGIMLDDYVDPNILQQCILPDINTSGLNLWCPLNFTDQIMESLSTLKHAKAYLKQDIPLDLHFNKSHRISKINILADVGYIITTNELFLSYPSILSGGSHGWNPKKGNMSGIFLANGPSFKKSTRVKSIQNIEIYNLISHIFNFLPSPNNGTFPYYPGIVKNE